MPNLAQYSCSLCVCFLCSLSFAQDTRSVVEPKQPKICQTLFANNDDSTQSIQTALMNCAKGQAVALKKTATQTVFLTGPLHVPTGVSLEIDSGVVLHAMNRSAVFDRGNHSCGTLGGDGNGCLPIITFDHVSGSGIYGPGEIDGQGDQQLQDQPWSWWQLARQAQHLHEKYSSPRLIQINHSHDLTFYQLNIQNAPHFGLVFAQSNGLTVWGLHLDNPSDARNTDAIDINSSENVTITHSYISTGDDHIAIKANIHTGPSHHISIIDNDFGAGHGLSIGSETQAGVYAVDVDGLSIHNAENGLRIKSDRSAAGEVSQVVYKNVTLANVKHALVQDTVYENKAGDTKANWHDIQYQNIQILGKSQLVFNGLNAVQPLEIHLQDVHGLEDVDWLVQRANVKK
ncbi:glycoside hydrolase family 28 protein [Acinetobacter rathckeae]|uniref:glycoside hydrolase family 28 protein n=1 Tax=Acinetobacter rathckeae TaxID=2605272 RepID=UPI0018A2C8E5|nr:glycosyl hydrolase family 28 protein [Acinetobacter rathckeae]MBF7689064.1 right-handed parallel beta-helix repeat-containing protein [Acinetobacter rathckeae]MBF7696584.1 right-handed parallel beta-helix repeat-containing protein [Acinetobacter rathckeae]